MAQKKFESRKELQCTPNRKNSEREIHGVGPYSVSASVGRGTGREKGMGYAEIAVVAIKAESASTGIIQGNGKAG